MPDKVGLLFLAAQPKGTSPLRLGDETRRIGDAIGRSPSSPLWEVNYVFAAKASDLAAALMRFSPTILHFSGHGRAEGIILEDDQGDPALVSGSRLRALLALFSGRIRLLVLSANRSSSLLGELADAADYVVATDKITDQSAIDFASAFYMALAFGRSVKNAFSWGQAQVQLGAGEPEAFTLTVGKGVDPNSPLLSPRSIEALSPRSAPPEIAASLRRFSAEHPDSEKVAFLMMRFGNTKAHRNIIAAVRKALTPLGITVVRADDKQYHDDLLQNVLTYAHGCGVGIAVFERIETDEFNPNVAFEVGYMLALGKDVCLLKDKTLKTLHADLVGRLYRTFDPLDPAGTIPANWEYGLVTKALASRERRESLP
jgi:hypothetical protein